MAKLRWCVACGRDRPLSRFSSTTATRCLECDAKHVSAHVKRCIQCRTVKPLSDFYRVHKGSAKRQARCKPCDNKVRAYGQRSTTGERVRPGGPVCRLCAGYAHRVEPEVEGASCPECGLAYAPLPELSADQFVGRGGDGAVYPEGGWDGRA